MSWKIPLFKIYWDKDDLRAVNDVISSGRDWAIGENIEKLEKALAGYVGTKYALAFSSGTSALHSLMIACGIGEGDEVIVTPFTFIATANAPLFVGARPVFADIEAKTYGIDPEKVKHLINKKTKAIMPIHFGGFPCQIEALRKIALKNKILLLEDAAESLGAKVNGKMVGSFSDAAIFSFCAPKVITTGEGGAVVTNSKKIYEALKLLRSHGRAETANYFSNAELMEYICLGYNFRMSNITAALGLSQMKKIGKIISMRRENSRLLSERLKKTNEIILPFEPKGYRSVYQMYTIRVKGGRTVRDALKKHLNEKGIMAKVYFDPVYKSKFYSAFSLRAKLPACERISSEVLTIPMYPELKKSEIYFMADEIVKFFRERK